MRFEDSPNPAASTPTPPPLPGGQPPPAFRRSSERRPDAEPPRTRRRPPVSEQQPGEKLAPRAGSGEQRSPELRREREMPPRKKPDALDHPPTPVSRPPVVEGERGGGRRRRGGNSGRGREPRRPTEERNSRESGHPTGEKSAAAGVPSQPEAASVPPNETASAAVAATAGGDNFLEELGGQLLEAVSRSFYLTIRLLPEPLRGPISLGYLLARAMDTVADSPADAVPTAARLEHLRALAGMIKYGTDSAALRSIQRDLVRVQKHAGERALLEKLDRCLAWLETLEPAADRWDLQRALTRIAYGQELDLQRFGADGEAEVRALQNAQQLDDYTYYVAGSAGELWTRLCGRHLPDFATLPQEEMLRLGRAFGQGLQLVNVLRDVRGDFQLSRCYLPADELAAAGIAAPTSLLQEAARLDPILRRWRLRAAERLDDAWRYVRALRGKKLRYACTLPVLLGTRTLALLAQAPSALADKPVKVTRGGLRNVMITAGIGMVAPLLAEAFYRRARRQAVA